MKDRNIAVLQKMVQYSDEINGTIARFELDCDKFKSDYVARNAISMCVLHGYGNAVENGDRESSRT